MRSISLRFIVIFVVLVMVNAVIFGVLFVRFYNDYDLGVVSHRVDALSELIIPKLESYDDFFYYQDEIAEYIELQASFGFREQVFVVAKNKIIATGAKLRSKDAEDILDAGLLIEGEAGRASSKIVNSKSPYESLRSYDKVYPVVKNNLQLGALYIKYDLKDLDISAANSVRIMISALLVSLTFSLIIAIFIGKGITKPINELTRQASKIANGNFDDRLVIRSDDEIGKLSGMFNYMAGKLSLSLNEIFTEKTKLEAIVNSMADALIAVSSRGEVLHINPAAKTMLRYMNIDEKYYYREIAESFPYELSFPYLIGLKKYKDFSFSYSFGDYIFDVKVEKFFDEKGYLNGFVMVFHDMTQERNLDNMRKDFIANVSHELKTPITIIKSYAETLLEDTNGEINRELRQNFLKVMDAEAARMNNIVSDLLQLSSLDSGKLQLNKEYHEWNLFISNVISKFKFQKEDVDIDFISSEEGVYSDFDYGRIEQVFINLITNSVKYSDEKPHIIIDLKEEADDVVIKLKDNGIGIEEKHLDKIFNRFYRVEKSRGRDLGGSGLGLSIVKHIIELHGATIGIESELGKGTTFTIRMPKS